MKISTKLAAATGAALAAGLLTAAPASAERTTMTARCPATLSPGTTGGTAAWTVECVGNHVYIDGWVKDTKADGKCAYVKAFGRFTDGTGRKEAKACPKNTTTRFIWQAHGSEISAYLYVA